MIPGSGISSKLPGYVPAKSISYGRRQVIKNHLVLIVFISLALKFQ